MKFTLAIAAFGRPASSVSPPAVAPAAVVSVEIDWKEAWKTVSTAATLEVDVMPFLARDAKEGGPFDGYYKAMENLGAAYVRFAPWYPFPRVAVTELYPPDCSAGGKGSSWNSTLLDGVMADFMTAVCGQNAAKGDCIKDHSVVPMITTIPAWMFVGGDDRVDQIPEDPWQTPSGAFKYYVMRGAELKDPTCKEMARYAARMVEWYTKGGTTDECGVRHESGLYYDWPLLSVLNEDEYSTPPEGGVEYTICWDAWKEEIGKVNPKMGLVGPESVSDLHYNLYFLNGSNHADGKPPPIVANHIDFYGPPWSQFFTGVDSWLRNFAVPLDNARQQMAPETEMVMNEFIPFNNDWCADDGANGCPDWMQSSSQGTKINRKTLGWSAAASSFAYGFGRMAELGYKSVGNDCLVAGPWPDNEPAVSSLDWDTGEPNAKYWAVRMLAELGAGPKRLFNASVTSSNSPIPYDPAGATVSTQFAEDFDISQSWTSHGPSIVHCVADNATSGDANIRSGHPGDVSLIRFHSGLLGAGHRIDAVSMSFRYQTGFPGEDKKAPTVRLLLLDADNKELKTVAQTDELMAYNGKHSPPIFLNATGLDVANDDEVFLAMEVTNNEQCLNIPLDDLASGFNARVNWAANDSVDQLWANPEPGVYALAMALESGQRKLLLVSKTARPQVVHVAGGEQAAAYVLEGVGDEPGFVPPANRSLNSDGALTLGPYGIALVTMPSDDLIV